MCNSPPTRYEWWDCFALEKSVAVSVLAQYSNLVDCQVVSNGSSFYLSFVYAFPEPSNRHYLWERLERIATSRSDPWLIMGDFNEIKDNTEKRGWPRRPESSFLDFRRMITTCDFQDLKSTGDKFSWTGKRYSHDVHCCLDRAMANSEWLALFPYAETQFLPFEESDHRPLVTSITALPVCNRKQFYYDSRLFDKDGFKEEVIKSWSEFSEREVSSLSVKLRNCRNTISQWKK